MRDFLIATILGLLLGTAAQAQAPPHIWSQSFGESGADVGHDLTTDPAGNVIVTGSFRGTIDFGGGPLISEGDEDVFVAKFDSAGAYLWSHGFGGIEQDIGLAVAVDSAGVVFVTGSFKGTVDFGAGPLVSAGEKDIFLLKLDAAGAHDWSQRFGDVEPDLGEGVVINDAGRVLLTGGFGGTVDFGGTPLVSAGGADIFLAAFETSNGAHVRSDRYGDTGEDRGSSVAVDTGGNTVLTGSFEGSLSFGGDPLVALGGQDIFLAKFDGAGTHLWSNSFGGLDADSGTDLVLSGEETILTGAFGDSVDFGGGALASNGSGDVFVAKFDADGVHVWSDGYGDTGADIGTGVTVTPAGDLFLTGHFRGSTDFGGGPLTSAGGADIFIAKFDSSGTHLWSQRFGDAAEDDGMSVTGDRSDGATLTGSFGGSVDFGGGSLTAGPDADLFVVRLDDAGAHMWSDAFGGGGVDVGFDVAVDGDGNVVIAGAFEGTVDFGGGSLVSAGNSDVFVAKYDPDGLHLWSRGFGDIETDLAQGLAIDFADEILVVGTFRDSVDFGGGAFVSAGQTDLFIVKLDASGNHVWSHRYGDSDLDKGMGISVDPTGSVIVTGAFRDSIDFGGDVLTSAGNYDIFLAKFDGGGVHSWSQSHGGPGYDESWSVVPDNDGNVLAAGFFQGTADLGGGPVSSAGASDGFLAKYDPNGDYLWSRNFGDTNSDYSLDIAVDVNRDVFLTGHFYGTVAFDGDSLVSAGEQDVFLVKYLEDGTHLWSQGFGDAGQELGYSISVDAAGDLLLSGYFTGGIDLGGGSLTSAGRYDIFLAKFGSTGTHSWSERFGGTGDDHVRGTAIDVVGNILLTGFFQETIDFGGGALECAGGTDIYIAKFEPGTSGVDFAGFEPTGLVPRPVYPNPFDAETTMILDMPVTAKASIAVYGVTGRLVRSVLNRELQAGAHRITWDGRDDLRRDVAPGIYYLRVESAGQSAVRKVVHLD